MQELVRAHQGETPQRSTSAWREQLSTTGLFTPFADRALPHVVRGTLDVLRARIASTSFIATLPESERAQVLADVEQVIAVHPEAFVQEQLVMPYVTQVTWCRAV
jgi:hypothetical protein